MIDNSTLAADLAPLVAELAAGSITQAAFATSLAAVLDTWNVQISTGALSAQIVAQNAAVQTLLTTFNAVFLKGVVATITDLPGTAPDGVAYIVTANQHAYARIGGVWIDAGSLVGPRGPAGSVAALTATAVTSLTPSASGTTITLPYTVGAGEILELDLNGKRQWAGDDYTLSGTTLTFAGAGVTASDLIKFRKLSVTNS
jgi:hypothetical protein